MITRLHGILLLPPALACLALPAFGGDGTQHGAVSPWMILPFLLLLLAIAIGPALLKCVWERIYPFVAVGLGFCSVAWYLLAGGSPDRILRTGHEYLSFVILIGSLFVVSGGILIRIRGRSRPLSNILLLAAGAITSNFVGTTGASMLLIRPFIRVNRYRIRPYHIVFFIILVGNLGGALTPIGDPPLFLGYLAGIPFFWVIEHLWAPWAVGTGCVLLIFYCVDRFSFARLPEGERKSVEKTAERGTLEGAANLGFLAIIIASVFITAIPFLREALMILAAAGSIYLTKREVHKQNEFSLRPIREVAFLFAGIFATMVPALDWLEQSAGAIGIRTPGGLYWTTGILSTVLDNAPTYLCFLSSAIGTFVSDSALHQLQSLLHLPAGMQGVAAARLGADVHSAYVALLSMHGSLVAGGNVPPHLMQVVYLLANQGAHIGAISIAAVFFGACTYIGNAPNFIVKSVSEHLGVKCPGFFGYIVRYTVPVLLPVLALVWFLFFRM